jgi:hypothetical protein
MGRFFSIVMCILAIAFFSEGGFAAADLATKALQTQDANVETNQAPQYWNFRVGERALNIQRNYAFVEVIGYDMNGTYVLRFLDGPLVGQIGGGWSAADLARRSGCIAQGACVGSVLMNLERNFVQTRLIAIDYWGRAVLYFREGPFQGQRGGNWDLWALARLEGCGYQFCVGNMARNRDRNWARVQVVGIQFNAAYVLRFLEGELAGLTGHNWTDQSLVATNGLQ